MLTKPRPPAAARLRMDSAQLASDSQSSSSAGEASGLYLPEKSRSEQCIAFGLFVLSFLYLCLFRRFTGICPDEGIVLQGAQRILDGQVLYRDFFSFFTPGSYYFNALLFRVFGDSFLVARTALAFMGAAFGVITYLLARRVCSREIALLVTGLMTITALPFRFMVLHNWDSTLLTCLALYCAVRWLESPHVKWAFATGSLVSLTGLFEQSKGAGLLLGLGLGFLIIAFLGDRPRKLFGRAEVLALAIGLTWPLGLTVIYFASQHALAPMLAGWLWPLRHYSGANHLPYGYHLPEDAWHEIFFSGSRGIRVTQLTAISSFVWIPVLPLFGVALLPRIVLQGIRSCPSVDAEWSHYVLLSSAMCGLLLSIVLVRADATHFIYLQPVFFLLLAWLIGGRNVRGPRVRRLGPVVAFCATISLLAIAMALLLSVVGEHYTLVTRRGVVHTQAKDTVVEQIQAHVAPGERILAYPYASLLYYVTRTYSPTTFEYYQPGMHTREQVMDMLSQLKAHPVRVVLWEPSFERHIRDSWPNTPARDLASDPVAVYIAQEYRPCASADTAASFHFLFMVRKDLACP